MSLRTAIVGERIGPDRVVDDRVCDCCATGAATTADGTVVVYRDRDAAEIRDISIAREAAGRVASPVRLYRDEWKIAGCPVNGPAVDASGRDIAVAWFTAAGSPQSKIIFSGDGGASFGRAIRVSEAGPGEHLGRVDVAWDGRGSAVVTWLEGESEKTASIMARRVSPTGELGRAVALMKTSPARASGFPRLAILGGDLLLAWTEVGPPSHVRMSRFPLELLSTSTEARSARSTAGPRRVDASGYEARTLDGQPASLEAYRGRILVLNVWATWCDPCREEMSELARIFRSRSGQDLAIVAVSVDDAANAEHVRRFVADRKIPFDVLLDPEDRISRRFSASSVPATFIFDRSLELKWSHHGKADIRELEAALARVTGRGADPKGRLRIR